MPQNSVETVKKKKILCETLPFSFHMSLSPSVSLPLPLSQGFLFHQGTEQCLVEAAILLHESPAHSRRACNGMHIIGMVDKYHRLFFYLSYYFTYLTNVELFQKKIFVNITLIFSKYSFCQRI